jgi:hypothetical protein
LLAAGAALVGAGPAQIERFDRIHHKVDHVTGRDPVAQVGRQKQRGVVVDVNEAGSISPIRGTGRVYSGKLNSKSDRLLAHHQCGASMVMPLRKCLPAYLR